MHRGRIHGQTAISRKGADPEAHANAHAARSICRSHSNGLPVREIDMETNSSGLEPAWPRASLT
jgi:hypothetical protein